MVIPQLQTNRDLYLAVNALSLRQKECDRTLETYLLAILNGSSVLKDHDALSLTEFYELIASGFTETPARFDEKWRDQYDRLPHDDDEYTGWRATIVRQIVDLREMDECGTLKNEMKHFGVYAPRNSYWYNFDPLGYLECAIAGSFGGWKPGDETGRDFVPGPVAELAEDGSIQSANPEDLPNPTYEMPQLTWEHFKDFVICGQIYE